MNKKNIEAIIEESIILLEKGYKIQLEYNPKTETINILTITVKKIKINN